MTKTNYLFKSLLRAPSPKICPYCKSTNPVVVDRKYFVTTLNQCTQCQLMYRHPVDTVNFNRKFYQEEYQQHDGITTELPSETELEKLMVSNFANSGKDHRDKIGVLKRLSSHPTSRIIDYGANWGYTSYQLMQAGFHVQAYEISQPRARFGNKLGLTILTDEKQLKGNVDIFFSSHVIEHLPDIKHLFQLAKDLLTDDGFFVAYCPNGSVALKHKNPALFHNFWGQVHPNYLSAEFFATVFQDVPYLIGSDGVTGLEKWDRNSQQILDVSGNELFVFAKIKKQTF